MKKMQLKNVTWSMKQKMWRVKNTLLDQHGEGYVDTAVKILIAVVLGALLLAGLYTLFNDTVLPYCFWLQSGIIVPTKFRTFFSL